MFSSNFSPPGEDGVKIGKIWMSNFTYVETSNEPEWSFFMHTHDHEYEISYVLGGRGALYYRGKYYELLPGTAIVKRPGARHAENADPARPIEQINLLVEGEMLEDLIGGRFPEEYFPPAVMIQEHRELMDSLAREMVRTIVGKDAPDLIYSNNLLRMMIATILDERRTAADPDLMKAHGKLMEEIRRWIDRHFMEPLSLGIIAEHFHVSIYYLARQFKKHTGLTVNSYIVSCRIGEAQRLLIFTDERINAIAEKCGFSNLSYFYTTFRKKVGCTPVEYKKTYRQTA